MKALDIVITPKGGIAFITETNNEGKQASISYIGGMNPGNMHCAWWDESELTVIDSIPRMLALAMTNKYGSHQCDIEKFYPIK